MKTFFLKIINYGVKQGVSNEITELHKLVNGISFLGVPVCVTYFILFSVTGFYFHAITFLAGTVIFILPLFLNKWLGLNFGRAFVSIMAPVFFGFVSVLTGKDSGFYLGFLVVTVPAVIVFPTIKQSVPFIATCVIFLILSILGNMYFKPLCMIPFSMAIYLMNLFTVLVTTLSLVILFKSELIEGREKLQEKNKEIVDSINYAKKIQDAYLPKVEWINNGFENAFILFKPKDIVSGDFYWFYMEGLAEQNLSGEVYVAAADCTGHGVPGAIMSVICCNAINEAVINKKINEPAAILNFVRDIIIKNLKSANQSNQKDGMDIALCKLNKNTNVLQFASANNPLWILRKNKNIIEEVKGDKQPVGFSYEMKPFNNHVITLEQGDSFYIFSDGYADQFGGPKGKKFKYKQLNELLLKISPENMSNQKIILENEFEKWKGDLEQIDDVCMVGIRI